MAAVAAPGLEASRFANLDFQIHVEVHETPPEERILSGKIQMVVAKKTGIHGMAVTLALTNITSVNKITREEGEKRFINLNETFRYMPFPDCSQILVGKKDTNIMDWIANPSKPREYPASHYETGLHEFPFCLDLCRLTGVVGTFEHKCERGNTAFVNKLFVTIAPFSRTSPNLITFPRKIHLANFAKLGGNLRKPAETTCCLKRGNQEVVKFTLTLNKQGYATGEEIEFRVEKWQKPNINFTVREATVALTRKITATVPQLFTNIRGTQSPSGMLQEMLLDKTIIGSQSKRQNATWKGSFRMPDGVIDTTGLTVAVTYGIELTVNIIGSAQPLKAWLPFMVGTTWDDGMAGSLSKNPWFSQFPRGSITSLNFDDVDLDSISLSSLPNYSSLSSRRSSNETLPPTYSGAMNKAMQDLNVSDGTSGD